MDSDNPFGIFNLFLPLRASELNPSFCGEIEDAKEVIRKFKSKDGQYIHLISLKTACL
jgi:hypothetical protein